MRGHPDRSEYRDANAAERLALYAVLVGAGCAIVSLAGLAAWQFVKLRLSGLEAL